MRRRKLYKYRGVEPFRNLTDILLKRRLYAAKYSDLNDPMEGQYILDPNGTIDQDIQRSLEGAKNNLRISSVSRKKDIELMWAHYADGNRGIVLGVTVDASKYDIRPVEYTGLKTIKRHRLNPSTPIEILSRKLEAWEYEEEERIFVHGEMFVDIELEEIILGSRMSNQDKSLITALAGKICPDVPIVRA